LDVSVSVIQASRSPNNASATTSPFSGIIVRLIIIAILFNGVKAGVKYRQLMRQSGTS
jgi:hypothetical protein